MNDIISWLQSAEGKSATCNRVAKELNLFRESSVSSKQWVSFSVELEQNLLQGIVVKVTNNQWLAIKQSLEFACGVGEFTLCFPNIHRLSLAVQLIARVLDHSLIHQGNYQLCGPAAVVVSMVRMNPKQYVDLAIALADKGRAKLKHWDIEPNEAIRAHNPEQGKLADWMVCASIRADTKAISDSSYGVSGAEDMFSWLCRLGYEKAYMMLDFPNKVVKSHPPKLIPAKAAFGSKQLMLRDMIELSRTGWQVIFLSWQEMCSVAQELGKIQITKHAFEDDPVGNEMILNQLSVQADGAIERLKAKNPSKIALLGKQLVGKLSRHTQHVMYIDSIEMAGNNVKVSFITYGEALNVVSIPTDLFINKMVGFIAVSDIA